MPVIDEESAAYAVKMSGLPLFLVGLNTFALLFVIDQHWAQVIAVVFAVLFVSLAFRIRAACTAWAPIAAFLSVTFFLLQVMWRFLTAILLGFHWQVMLAEAARLIVPTLAVILAMGGLRGWKWLRRNGVTQRY
ncbi:hypothetical protein DS901_16140 [Loktanella sp. D2R18]|uniref:hypothetical protein n=1 Tax=Rhodobacterales TaxID=204455 RepID=UPI000DE8485F|nr:MULTISPECIES: hypothetical protein [Rhodobacterales]RBW42235.1 hypothetical protein DS901_16140 [Loktanella sp. D2R18]